MIQFTETYTWKQQAVLSKLSKLRLVIDMVNFSIDGYIENIFQVSEMAAIEGMKIFAKRLDLSGIKNFRAISKIEIYGKPQAKQLSVDDFVGIELEKENLDITDYRKMGLAHALLEPPYGLGLKKNVEKYTYLYKVFVQDFLGINNRNKNSFTIYEWSDDWSNYFDDGKEWWGTYYWTIFNRNTNTIIVVGGSSTD